LPFVIPALLTLTVDSEGSGFGAAGSDIPPEVIAGGIDTDFVQLSE
jgi:hypothetical protein